MKIAVASGKGGTGKTTVSIALTETLGSRGILLDCDVEEPNCHLFVPGKIEYDAPFSVMVPEFQADKCTGCGKCSGVCRFNALASLGKKVLVFPELCHSCGACLHACPTGAMMEGSAETGRIIRRDTGAFPLFTGELRVGNSLSVPLIRQLKNCAADDKVNILDAPPGTACPMVNTVRGCDYVILVTEPTPFGLHDLAAAVETLKTMQLPFGVIVNRAENNSTIPEDYCREHNIDILLRIPFSRSIAEGYAAGKTLLQSKPELKERFAAVLKEVELRIKNGTPATETEIKISSTTQKQKSISQATVLPEIPAQSSEKELKEILVLSGKGGTGKTSISACFARLSSNAVFCDCDVDASNLHLLLAPETHSASDFHAGWAPELDPECCSGCGKCSELCNFKAITLQNGLPAWETGLCEGCGVCADHCPSGTITMHPRLCGRQYISASQWGPLFHAELLPGEENSGKLIAELRRSARAEAEIRAAEIIISDGPPGIGCPVISSMSGVDLVVVVTEPSCSGLHDLKRVIQLAYQFEIPVGIIINKWDINPEISETISGFCSSKGCKELGRIPYDPVFQEMLRAGKTVLSAPESIPAQKIKEIWNNVRNLL